MKFCSKCGNELFDEAVICVRCGCATGYQVSSLIVEEPKKKPAKPKNRNGLGTASMVLGIISIIFITEFVGWICGILGIIFSAVSIEKCTHKRAKAGLILSTIGLSLSLIFTPISLFLEYALK